VWCEETRRQQKRITRKTTRVVLRITAQVFLNNLEYKTTKADSFTLWSARASSCPGAPLKGSHQLAPRAKGQPEERHPTSHLAEAAEETHADINQDEVPEEEKGQVLATCSTNMSPGNADQRAVFWQNDSRKAGQGCTCPPCLPEHGSALSQLRETRALERRREKTIDLGAQFLWGTRPPHGGARSRRSPSLLNSATQFLAAVPRPAKFAFSGLEGGFRPSFLRAFGFRPKVSTHHPAVRAAPPCG